MFPWRCFHGYHKTLLCEDSLGSKGLLQPTFGATLARAICTLIEYVIFAPSAPGRTRTRTITKHNILTDAQHGFRKKRSCESQLIVTLHNLAKSLDEKSQVDVILLDFEKAFNKVSHRHLLHKAEFYGIHGNILNWTRDFLKDWTRQVLLEGQRSEESQSDFRCTSGECARASVVPDLHQWHAIMCHQLIHSTFCRWQPAVQTQFHPW